MTPPWKWTPVDFIFCFFLVYQIFFCVFNFQERLFDPKIQLIYTIILEQKFSYLEIQQIWLLLTYKLAPAVDVA